MSADVLFSTSNLIASAGWLLLIFAGRVNRIATLIAGVMIPLLLSVVYTAIIVTRFGASDGGFGSIHEVRALFANDWLLLAGWAHYLAFDLFIGSWQVRDSQKNGIPHLIVIPSLVLTFLFGPAGLLIYMIIRRFRTHNLAIES